MQLRRIVLTLVRKAAAPMISAGFIKRPTPLNLRFRIVESNTLISQKRYSDALDVIWELGQRNLAYPYIGQQIHKIAVYAQKHKDTEIIQKITRDILPAYQASSLKSTEFNKNKAYVCFLAEDWSGTQAALLTLEAGDVNIHNLLWDVHVKRVQLCAQSGEFEPEFQYLATLLDAQLKTNKMRTQAARMALSSLEYAQQLGQDEKTHAPLLTPSVLKLVSPESLRTITPSLPETLRSWIATDQVPRARVAAPSEAVAGNSPLKILLSSEANWNFLKEVSDVFEDAGIEVRFLPFEHIRRAIDQANKDDREHPTMVDMLYASGPFRTPQKEGYEMLEAAAPWATDLIEWCDVVFVEWWNAPAVWCSRYLPDDKALVVRCHSYEAFTTNPYFTNMQRIDGAIFIADHIREVFLNGFCEPGLALEKTKVIQNIRLLQHLSLSEKSEEAQFTLGLMQYSNWNKDPIFALDILEHLIEVDSRWTLRLVGTPWNATLSDFEQAYRTEFLAKLEPLKQNVIIDPFTRDVEAWRTKIGYILSTSRREGSHESIVEGMATGIIPVLRRWPFMKQFGAPESMFPGIPAFDTAQDAAQFILAQSQRTNREAYRASISEQTLKTYDASVAGPELIEYVQAVHQSVHAGVDT